MTQPQLDNIFSYHAPINNQPKRYETIRNAGKVFAKIINNSCPDSREKSIAITKLQETVMFANAAIAINEVEIKP